MPTRTRPLMLLSALVLVALAFASGCAKTRRYNVQVLNQTDAPVTVGLAKLGEPFEPHLASPEGAALSTPSADENLWPSETVAPGRIGYTRVEGKFAKGADLTLRVYGGKRTLSEVLSVPPGSSERVEAVLRSEPALNKFIVTRQEGRLTTESVERFPATQPAGK